jgi:hypothetical protein
MNFRFTAALFGLVFVVGAVLLVLSLTTDTGTKNPDVLCIEMLAGGITADKPEKVDALEFERADGSALVIVRTDPLRNTWQIQKPISAKADTSKVMPVISALLKAKPVPYSELSANPAVHGLDPPGLKVTIRAGSDRASTVNLGDVTMGDKGVVFVTTSSQSSRPMAVRRTDLDALFREPDKDGKAVDLAKWTSDFRAPAVFPADSRAMGEDVASIKLELPNKKKELALSRSGGKWKFDSPAGWGDADTEGDPTGPSDKFTGVGPLLRALANVTALVPADFIDNPGPLAQYGLNPDNPDRIRIEMKTRDGQSAVVYFGKIEAGTAPPPIPGLPAHPPAAGKVFVSIEGLPGVIRASAVNLGGLAAIIADPAPLRDRNLLTLQPGKQVDGLDLVLAGQAPDKPTKLRKVGGEWRLYGGPNDPQSANPAAVAKMIEVLTAKRSIKDFPAPNPANFATVPATVYVWVDGFAPPVDPKAEPGKRSEPVKLEFGATVGDTVFVRRTLPGGQPIEFGLPTALKLSSDKPEDLVQAVSKTRLDLLDRGLPSFSDTTPTRIAVTGVNTYSLAKDEKPDPATKEQLWRYTAPPNRKGEVADGAAVRNDLIYTLANQSSWFDRFVNEAPTPEQLVGYGLSPPRLKVMVGTDAKSENDRGFEYGKDVEGDPDKVYARVVGRSAVFKIQRRTFDRFANPDLRDRVIFRGVPVAAVNSVELTGWGGITLKFDKNKDGAWTAQPPTPPTFQVDPAKLNAFLELLTRVPVKSFEKGPPEAKHGFGDPKQNLQVILRWPGGAISLNLGASPDMGGTFYGSSAWLPQSDPVFTIDGGLFKPFKDSAAGFAK